MGESVGVSVSLTREKRKGRWRVKSEKRGDRRMEGREKKASVKKDSRISAGCSFFWFYSFFGCECRRE